MTDHVVCNICGEILHRDDAIAVNGHFVCKQGICKGSYEYCPDCGRIVPVKEAVETKHGIFCKHCARKHT